MSDELIKELSRLQLLSSRCKNKMSMCPLSITLEENRAYLIFNYIKELKAEKQELKKKYENAVADYETAMFEKEQLNSLVNSCQEEIRQLKKQFEELKQTNKVLSEELTKDKILKQDCLTTCCGIPIGDIPKLINQQKEFIQYLENMLDNENDIFSVVRVKDILSKYEEIIGGK